jgi:membrane protease YdiL (CAAX protease family)
MNTPLGSENTAVSENERPWTFFLITFALSWLIWAPAIILPDMSQFATIFISLGASMPSLTAFILTYQKERIDGIKRLLKRGIDYKIGKIWFIPTFLIIPVCIFGSFVLSMFIDNRTAELFDFSMWTTAIMIFFLMFPIILFIGGPINEEFGWRGYSLDGLQSMWHPLGSGLILGTIWAVWHLPLFFMPGSSQNLLLVYLPIAAALQIVIIILMSIIFSWLYNNTGGSILVAILFHNMWNVSFNVLMSLIFMQFGITDPSQVSTLDQSSLNSASTLIISSNLFISLAFILIVILIIWKYGVSLKKNDSPH